MTATITLIVSLLVVVVALSALATRLALPSPIVLVVGGVLLSFLPGLPTIDLAPDLVLFLFLPPLIYASAWQTSWREFHANVRSILVLAIGLVLVTTTLVAVVAHYLVGLPWGVAFVLGAIVSPTDAVAASATAQRLGLSRRIVTVLEGESMVNDATGLVVYRFAVAAVVSGLFSLGAASLQFVVVSVGGLLVGLALSWPIARLHRALDDAPLEITITLVTPFVVYLCAEAVHVSGVLAVMSAGLYLSRQSARFFSSTTRLQANAVWEVLVFLLNGLLFVLIGLQLQRILTTIAPWPWPLMLGNAVAICLTVILTRVAWVFPGTYLPRMLSVRLRQADPYPGWRNVLLIAWAGLRGGLSLAAAFALPLTIASGVVFPERDRIIFLTFCVIVATLVVQGLGLVPLIRILGLRADLAAAEELQYARQVAIRAALDRFDAQASNDGVSEAFLEDLRMHYEEKLRHISGPLDGSGPEEDPTPAQNQLRRAIIAAERAAVIQLRDQGRIADDVLRTIERELDLEEQRLSH
ncbi:MAG TPA: Na+/H+ antiporter [Roseiflexaceae bacterium]|nr:Na+/H+ antiporter [Roseiflexaceae bacterium]